MGGWESGRETEEAPRHRGTEAPTAAPTHRLDHEAIERHRGGHSEVVLGFEGAAIDANEEPIER